MLCLLLAAITVNAGFEGGALRKHEWLTPTHLVATIPGQADHEGRNHQPSWFHFSLTGVKDTPLTIDIAGFEGEYNYRPHDGRGHRNTRPAYSYDGQTWTHFSDAEWLESPSRLRLRFTPREDTVRIARIPPYGLREVNRLLDFLRAHPAARVAEIGRSVQNRPLHAVTLGSGPRDVWILSRQHAWEAGVSWALEGSLRFLASDTPDARALLASFTFHVIPTLDPDGLVHGGVRFNRNGYDLNRNWDTATPAKMPEIAAAQRWMLALPRKPALFLCLHNTESADFLQGPLTRGGAPIRRTGETLDRLLNQTSHFHAPNGVRDYPATAPAKGRMTADEWGFLRTGAPSFLLELMVDTNTKIGRPPDTGDRLQFGAAFIRAIAATLSPAP